MGIEIHKNRILSSNEVQQFLYKRFILNISSVQKLSLIEFEMKVFLLLSLFCLYVQGNSFSVESKQGSSRRNLIHETFSTPLDRYSTLLQPQKSPCVFDYFEKSMDKFLILENYMKFNRKCFKSVKSFHFLRFLSRQKC